MRFYHFLKKEKPLTFSVGIQVYCIGILNILSEMSILLCLLLLLSFLSRFISEILRPLMVPGHIFIFSHLADTIDLYWFKKRFPKRHLHLDVAFFKTIS